MKEKSLGLMIGRYVEWLAPPAIFCAVLLIASPGWTQAEDYKKQLIERILELTFSEAQLDQIMNALFQQGREIELKVIQKRLEEKELSADQRREVLQLTQEYLESSQSKAIARMSEQISASDLAQSFIPTYEQYFDTSELEFLVEFYESEVGQKLITLTPRLMAEGMQSFQKLFGPKMMEIAETLQREGQAERADFLAELEKVIGEEEKDVDPTGLEEADLSAPTPESLAEGRATLERILEASGSADSLRKLQDYRLEALQMADGATWVLKVDFEVPDKCRADATSGTGVYWQVVLDGNDGRWTNGDTVNSLDGDEKATHRESCLLNNYLGFLWSISRDNLKAQLVENKELESFGVRELRFQFDDKQVRAWVDTRNWYVRRVVIPGNQSTEFLYYDFKLFGDLTLPEQVVSSFDGKPFSTYRIRAYQIDSGVDPELFDRPEGKSAPPARE